MATINGSSGDDNLIGGINADLLVGMDGNDTLNGKDGNDTLNGGDGNDLLIHTTGSDTLNGGANNDVYLFKNSLGAATINDSAGNDTLDFSDMQSNPAGMSVLLSSTSAQLMFSGTFSLTLSANNMIEKVIGTKYNDAFYGNIRDNVIMGSAGDDFIDDSSGGDDTFNGGAGHDIYFVRRNNIVINESPGGGSDIAYYFFSHDPGIASDRVANNIEAAILSLGTYLRGNSQGNILMDNTGSFTDVTLAGGAGNDIYVWSNANNDINTIVEAGDVGTSSGRDMLDFSWINVQVNALLEFNFFGTLHYAEFPTTGGEIHFDLNAIEDVKGGTAGDFIIGSPENNRLWGNAGNDSISGTDGHDTLNGGAGDDGLDGGLGNDTYVFVGTGIGIDDISPDSNGNNILDFSNYGTLGITFSLANTDAQTLNGSDSLDINSVYFATLIGTRFDDTFSTDAESTTVLGKGGNDYLYGSIGTDTLNGGAGNDTYYFQDFWFATIEDSSGLDKLYTTGATASVTVNLSNNPVNVPHFVNPIAPLSVSGAEGSYTIAPGTVIEYVYNGSTNDTVIGTNVTNLFEGGNGADYLSSGGGNDTLYGGTGNDTLIGGSGDDFYSFVPTFPFESYGADSVSDSGGFDALSFSGIEDAINVDLSEESGTIFASSALGSVSASASTKQAIERVVGTNFNDEIMGNDSDNLLEGSGGNDSLWGLSGNDTLDGGTSADTMVGGTGNDLLYVNHTSDAVFEDLGAAGGIDRVSASVNFSADVLSSEGLENITLTGIADSAIGNTLNNQIEGNTVNNLLDGQEGNDLLKGFEGDDELTGGEGVDTMQGGIGFDSYYVDETGDVIVESAPFEADTVFSTADSYTLPENVEHLELQGNIHSEGIGNSHINNLDGNNYDNLLVGNGAGDDLDGNAGNDTLQGGSGNDVLTGAQGNDLLQGGSDDDDYYFDVDSNDVGEDVLIDSGGAADELHFVSTELTDVYNWYAMDNNGNGSLDALFVDFISGESMMIEEYFDDSSNQLTNISGGQGLIELLTFTDAVLDFDGVVNLAIPLV